MKIIYLLVALMLLVVGVRPGPVAFSTCAGISGASMSLCLAALAGGPPAFFTCLAIKGGYNAVFLIMCSAALFAPTPWNDLHVINL